MNFVQDLCDDLYTLFKVNKTNIICGGVSRIFFRVVYKLCYGHKKKKMYICIEYKNISNN